MAVSHIRGIGRACVATIAFAGWTSSALAQGAAPAYPVKPVTLYVGFSAGSTNDNTARTMAHRLTETLGQQFVVVNRDGMSGALAAGAVAKSKPDGYSLLWGSTSAVALGPAFNHNLPYDPLKDFAPISVYFYIPLSTSLAAPHIQSGRLRAIGVTSSQRSPQLPDVPTISESGLPGYEIVGWYSMLAPAGTPPDIVMTLHRSFVKALEHPAVKANIAAEGALPGGNTPEQFSALIRAEFEKYTKLIKDARLKPEQ